MKKVLIVILLLVSSVLSAQKKFEWIGLNNMIDSAKNDLKTGNHEITLKITDGTSVIYHTLPVLIVGDSNNIRINFLPVADAGEDATWPLGKTATISARGYDRDGTIISYYWKKMSGPREGKISYPKRQTTTLTNLRTGVYVYRLTVTDSNGGTAEDFITLTVK